MRKELSISDPGFQPSQVYTNINGNPNLNLNIIPIITTTIPIENLYQDIIRATPGSSTSAGSSSMQVQNDVMLMVQKVKSNSLVNEKNTMT